MSREDSRIMASKKKSPKKSPKRKPARKKSVKKSPKKSSKKKPVRKKSPKKKASKKTQAKQVARTTGPVVSAQRMFNLAALSETVSGPGVAASLPQHVLARGKRAFIVTDQGV
nr:hypothetical protein [Acidobacteriota bacterium]